ncbi:MAG: hypothetical protein M1115_09585 [Actinobacteria bacterium]|nr:hypothetical protein [Actinomycetota bacterium]
MLEGRVQVESLPQAAVGPVVLDCDELDPLRLKAEVGKVSEVAESVKVVLVISALHPSPDPVASITAMLTGRSTVWLTPLKVSDQEMVDGASTVRVPEEMVAVAAEVQEELPVLDEQLAA